VVALTLNLSARDTGRGRPADPRDARRPLAGRGPSASRDGQTV